jgi:hypothetical protein
LKGLALVRRLTAFYPALTCGSRCVLLHLSGHIVLAVTADPAEGEALTDAGSNLVEAVLMPPDVVEAVIQFIAQHHVQRAFVKRQRERQATFSSERKNGE